MSIANDENAWRIFQRDSEAGRLLSRLYGVPPASQKVNYPKLRRRRTLDNENTDDKNDHASKGWKPTYCVRGRKKEEQEEREKQRKIHRAKALSLMVPKVGSGKHGSRAQDIHAFSSSGDHAKVDLIPRRKNQSQCNDTIIDYKFVNKKFRPAHAHAFSSDEEKQRLNGIFGKKGRCLPEDLTSAPIISGSQVSTRKQRRQEEEDSLFDQIYQEIIERREHQLQMEELGAGVPTRDSTANEIKVRLEQLKKIDPGRAIDVTKKLLNS